MFKCAVAQPVSVLGPETWTTLWLTTSFVCNKVSTHKSIFFLIQTVTYVIVITSCSSAEIGSLNFVHFFCNAFRTIPSSSSNFFVDILYHPKNRSSYLRKSGYNMKNSPFSNRKLFIGCIQTLLTWISRRCIIITKAKWHLLHCTLGKGIFAQKNSKSRWYLQYLLSKKWHNM